MCKINKCKPECKEATQTWWKLCQVAWTVLRWPRTSWPSLLLSPAKEGFLVTPNENTSKPTPKHAGHQLCWSFLASIFNISCVGYQRTSLLDFMLTYIVCFFHSGLPSFSSLVWWSGTSVRIMLESDSQDNDSVAGQSAGFNVPSTKLHKTTFIELSWIISVSWRNLKTWPAVYSILRSVCSTWL